MNLYLITRTDHGADYDEYDSAVVCAESEEQARDTHPGGGKVSELGDTPYGTWVPLEFVRAKLIGTAAPFLPAGVVCSSFNAG